MPKKMIWPQDFINKIICGDCLIELKEFPNNSVDLTLTSPPFYDKNAKNLESFIDYYLWLREILKELRRISKIIFMFNSSKRLKELCIHLDPDRILIWDKKRTESAYRYEPIFCWANKINLNKYIWNDCLAYIPVLGKQQQVPYQNPLILYKMLISFFRDEIKIILDPFLGSGTTAVACKELNKKFIGIEINPDYCEIARKRLAQEYLKF